MSDLDKLIAAVEAGDLGVLSTTTLDPPSGYLTRDMARLCVHACDGSLDAALRLHEALLPGWAVDDMSENGRMAGHPWGIRLAYWNAYRPNQNKHVDAGWGADHIPDRNPARAWLLAILRALKAQQP